MKIIKTSNYKKAQQYISYQEIFNDALKRNNGNKIEAAKALLDISTNGIWASWDQIKIDKGIKKILNQFGGSEKIDQQLDNRSLELKLLDWHGGQNSPLYALGSSWLAGKAVSDELIGEALVELEDIAQKKVNYPKNISSQDIKEIRRLQEELMQTLGRNKGLYHTNNPKKAQSDKWLTGKVFTKAPGFGDGKEVEESKIITIRPEENEAMALKREGFDPLQSRIEIINR